MRIAYLFADHGAEAEALRCYGEVIRYTIDPEPNPHVDRTVQMNLMDETPDIDADWVVCHPECTKYSQMPGVDPDDHENQIPRARELAESCGEHYTIENRPNAPLNDPTTLGGRMFGLPIRYERGFETSFRVPQPPRTARLAENAETSPFFYSERSPAWWRSVKGVGDDYPPEHLAKNVVPMPYIHFLGRAFLEATGRAEHVADYSDYSEQNERERREAENHQLPTSH